MSPDTQDARPSENRSSNEDDINSPERKRNRSPGRFRLMRSVNILNDLEQRLSDAEAKAEEHWNMYLRALADLENFQRRMARDLEFNIRSGKKEIFLKLLAIVDDMERALEADADYESLHRGVEMIMGKLLDALASEGVEPIDALDKPFDPRFHEAVAASNEAGIETETIVEEFRRGYTYCDECLRPTMARVAVPRSD